MSVPGNNFGTGFICALLLVFWIQLIRWQAHRVSAFFAPDSPHLGPKPSAYVLFTGCLSGLFWLVIIVVGGAWVITAFLRTFA